MNTFGLFNAEVNIVEKQWWYYSTHIRWNKRGHIFPKGKSPKVNIIARRELELYSYSCCSAN